MNIANRTHQQAGTAQTEQRQTGEQAQIESINQRAGPVDDERRREGADHVSATPATGVETEIRLDSGAEHPYKIGLSCARHEGEEKSESEETRIQQGKAPVFNKH
jgi:hypothetical protein